MSDYIKRDELKQKMYHEAFENDASYDERNPMAKWNSGLWIRYKLFENVLASIPSADVVNIVRCSECKWWQSDGGALMLCEVTGLPTEENHYCSWGRKE